MEGQADRKRVTNGISIVLLLKLPFKAGEMCKFVLQNNQLCQQSDQKK
jgi:hypothetical protein